MRIVNSVNYFALGKELLENGCPEGAIQALDESIRRYQYLPEALLYRGRAYLALGAFVHAQDDLEAAARHDARLTGLCQFHLEALERRRSRALRSPRVPLLNRLAGTAVR